MTKDIKPNKKAYEKTVFIDGNGDRYEKFIPMYGKPFYKCIPTDGFSYYLSAIRFNQLTANLDKILPTSIN